MNILLNEELTDLQLFADPFEAFTSCYGRGEDVVDRSV